MQLDLVSLLNRHKALFARVADQGNGMCLCGRGESCSVCSRSGEQRDLEQRAAAAVHEIDTILAELNNSSN